MSVLYDQIPTHTTLRISDEPLLENTLYALTAISHMHDYHFADRMSLDIAWLNRAYTNIWLALPAESYHENKIALENFRTNYTGNIYNLNVDVSKINNDPFYFDVQLGYVGNNLYFLKGDESLVTVDTENKVKEVAQLAHLDIGVINVVADQVESSSISTCWKLAPSLISPGGEEQSIAFLNAITDELGMSRYWNSTTSDQLRRVLFHSGGAISIQTEVDEDSIPDNSRKIAFITDHDSQLSTQLNQLRRYKIDTSFVVINNPDEDLETLENFDYIVFMCSTNFPYAYSKTIQYVKQHCKAQIVNLSASEHQHRSMQLKKWTDAGILAPLTVSGFGHNIPDPPFDPPYIIRGSQDQDGRSNPAVYYDKSLLNQWPWWIWSDRHADFVIQQFIDTSIDGRFHTGRLWFAGDERIPGYAMEANAWEVRLKRDILVRRSHSLNCFSEIFPSIPDDFDQQINRIIEVSEAEIGVLDFGIKDGYVIPWEINLNWGFDYAVHDFETTLERFAQIVNAIFKYAGSTFRVNAYDAKVVLEESNLEMRLWHFPPIR